MSTADFTRLIDAHAAPLVLYARQWCDAPEDVVQDAFLKLVRQGRPPEDVVAWLYRVVRNGALDAAKLARRRHRRESSAARPVRWFVEPEVDGLDAGTAVAALERLVPEQREVIVAHHWGGLSFEQVGAVVGCSASTAFRRYTAGVEVLRKQLGGNMSEPILERLSRFTPDAGGLDRDALLFAAGRSSARPNRGWMTLASLLAGTQALSLAMLWPRPTPPAGGGAGPVATAPAPSADLEPPSPEAVPERGLWSARHRLLESVAEDRPAEDVTLIDGGPPLRASPRLSSLLN